MCHASTKQEVAVDCPSHRVLTSDFRGSRAGRTDMIRPVVRLRKPRRLFLLIGRGRWREPFRAEDGHDRELAVIESKGLRH